MASPDKPYARYGPYILLRMLEESVWTQTWRAGRLVNQNLEENVTLLRFNHGDLEGLAHAMKATQPPAGEVAEAAVAGGQRYDVIGFDPVITWNYTGGRSLRHLLRIAGGDQSNHPNPIPIDQALAIAERLAQALEASSRKGTRHGALLPSFVWMDDDGGLHIVGHGLHAGILGSLADPLIRDSIGGFFAPELVESGEPTPSSEVYAVGAILLTMLTGKDPAPVAVETLGSTMTANGEAIPEDVREILERSLATTPSDRYGSPEQLKKAIGKLTHGGAYAPTTFNLAFYFHSVFREELDREAAELEREKGLDPKLVPPFKATTPRPLPGASRKTGDEVRGPFAAHADAAENASKGRRTALVAVALLALLLAAGAAGWYFVAGPGATTKESPATESVPAIAEATPPEPSEDIGLVAITDTGPTPSEIEQTDTAEPEPTDTVEEEREAMIRAEIERRVQAELDEYQRELDRQLASDRAALAAERARLAEQNQPEPSAPRQAQPQTPEENPPATGTAERELRPSPAEELDRATPESSRQQPPATTTAPATTTTATTTAPPPARETAPVQPPPEPAVQEGDLVGFNELDTKPTFARRARTEYPAIARRQKIEETILVSVLISETGKVLETKIVKGESRRLGFDGSAIRALEGSTFNPGIKDGKRVRTWWVVPVSFRLSN
ncbi:MAG: TonB family protein [Acidobacteria bacterium]|nr:TonB family protein [Acidobacteriota bacterium]